MSKPALCHPEKTAKGRGMCSACYERRRKIENPEYAQRQRENSQRWRDRKGVEWTRAYDRARYAENPRPGGRIPAGDPRQVQRHLKTYGLTVAELASMVKQQRGTCAICQQAKKLVIDHDHATGKVRGLLCYKCNTMLGYFESGTPSIASLKRYLRAAS